MDYSDRFDEFFMYHFQMDEENISLSDRDEKYFLKISPLALNGRPIILENSLRQQEFQFETVSARSYTFWN